MASWNKVTAGDTLYDVRRQSNGVRTYSRKQLEKLRVKRPTQKETK